MTKTFCDGCGIDLDEPPFIDSGASVEVGKLKIDIVRRKDTDGDVCKYCIIKAISKLDDRPQPA